MTEFSSKYGYFRADQLSITRCNGSRALYWPDQTLTSPDPALFMEKQACTKAKLRPVPELGQENTDLLAESRGFL
jgi:hypothetical protein